MTAMEELIEGLTRLYYMDYGGAKEGIKIAIDTAMNQLQSIKKEKEQLEEAFDAGSAYEVPDDLHYGLKYSTFQDWQQSLKATSTE